MSFEQQREKVIKILDKYSLAEIIRGYDEDYAKTFYEEHKEELNAVETLANAKAAITKYTGIWIDWVLYPAEIDDLYTIFREWRASMNK